MATGRVNLFNNNGTSIKSIQVGQTLMSQNSSSINLPIEKVDINNSIVLSVPLKATIMSASCCLGSFVNEQTIKLYRSDSNYAIDIYYEIIEFENVKSFQTISFSLSSNLVLTYSKEINEVDPNKCLVFLNYRTYKTGDTSTSYGESSWYYTLGTNNIKFNFLNNYMGKNCTAYIVEFN